MYAIHLYHPLSKIHQNTSCKMNHTEWIRHYEYLWIIRNTIAHSWVSMRTRQWYFSCVAWAKVILSWTTTAMWTTMMMVAPTFVGISKFDENENYFSTSLCHKIHHKNGLQRETDPMDVWYLQGQNEIVGAIKSEWLFNCDVPVCMFLGLSSRVINSSMSNQALGTWAMPYYTSTPAFASVFYVAVLARSVAPDVVFW